MDAKLEQLKQEREQKLKELEDKKKLMQQARQIKLNKLKNKHTNSNSSINSESSGKANLNSNQSNHSNKSTEENSYRNKFSNGSKNNSKSDINDSRISVSSKITYQSQQDEMGEELNLQFGGIDENKADKKHLDNLGKEMLDA